MTKWLPRASRWSFWPAMLLVCGCPTSRAASAALHAYGKAVADHTAASNSLRAYLNGNAIRPAKGNLELESTRQWMLKQRDWSPMQKEILAEHFGDLDACKERRKRLYRLIAAEMSGQPMMLRSMKVLGVGLINAFALLAVIGDVRRFQRPEKLVAYIGLNPGQRQSGTGKNIKLGVGKRGRGDIRHLLIQGAQAVLRNCRGFDRKTCLICYGRGRSEDRTNCVRLP